MTSIAEFNRRLTPQQRSENAHKAAMTKAKKAAEEKERNENDGIIDIPIEYDIPMPKPNFGKLIYPFLEKMKVGSCVKIKDKGLFMRVYAAAGGYGKSHNKTFAGRTLKGEFGLWRIK